MDHIEIEFQLHCTGVWPQTVLVASDKYYMVPGRQRQPLRYIKIGSVASQYLLSWDMKPQDAGHQWISLPVHLIYDNIDMGAKPLPLYIGEVDQWHGGMAHYPFPYPMTEYERKSIVGGAHVFTSADSDTTIPTPMYTLSARRSN